jgi:NAD(P)-dependent dehydrogenase (short-subunit alcohol dehydrogenase family)
MDWHDSELMAGKTVLVTGASGGIGKATAAGLSRKGAHVALVGRDPERLHAAAQEIHDTTGRPVDAFTADLSDQSEVRHLAAEVLERLPRLDVLVNNVGGYWNTRHLTEDGLERTLALNHLAPFLLTNLLLGRLAEAAGGRVVTVASNAEALGRIDFDDLQGTGKYSGARAYNESKLANILFTYELARRLRGTPVTANALHPGLVNTSFGAADPGIIQRVLVPIIRPLMKTATGGAATSVHLASAPELATVSGLFFARGRPKKSSQRSYDTAVAKRLWQVSAQLTGLPASTLGPPH